MSALDKRSAALENFDVDLQDFYYEVISKEMDISKQWQMIGVKRAMKEVIEAYQKITVRKYQSSIRFDTPAKRCAYLLKHSPLFTSAVATYMQKLVLKNKRLFDEGKLAESLEKGEFCICCLGGGPASDAVGVIRVIRNLYEPYFQQNGQKPLKLMVSVVDISEDWQTTAANLLDCLKTTTKIIAENMINISYSFYTANLTEPVNNDIKTAIKTADVVTMIYFVSAVNGSKDNDKSETMMETIIINMKRGAILFFLDSAADHHYQILHEAATKRNTVEEIYGPLSEEFYHISTKSVQKFLDLYAKHFQRFVCMTNIFLAVSAWYKPLVKSTTATIKKSLAISDPSKWQKPSEEESERLTRHMKNYRGTVQRMVNEYS